MCYYAWPFHLSAGERTRGLMLSGQVLSMLSLQPLKFLFVWSDLGWVLGKELKLSISLGYKHRHALRHLTVPLHPTGFGYEVSQRCSGLPHEPVGHQ